MPKVLIERSPDVERQDDDFLRQAGIDPDVTPRISRGKRVALVLALAAAAATTLFGAAFATGAVDGMASSLDSCVTSCPMVD